jgi:hypothetical protein
MPTKNKTVSDETFAELSPAAQADLTLFDNWDDDPAVVEVGGFDSELWAPESVGDHVVGFRARTRFEVGPNKSTMYELETRDGLRSVWGATVLDNKMENVPEGSLVRIEFLGEKRGSENEYYDFSVKFKLVPSHAVEAGRVSAIANGATVDVAPY